MAFLIQGARTTRHTHTPHTRTAHTHTRTLTHTQAEYTIKGTGSERLATDVV